MLTLALTFVVLLNHGASSSSPNLTLITVASEQTDGFKRFMRSAKHYDYDVKVLGMGKPWKGGDMNFPGGGYKVNLLKEALTDLVVEKGKEHIVMFTDSYDVVINDKPEVIAEKFLIMDAGVVFSAEPFIWPDVSLEPKYPAVEKNQKRFLNSGGIIGKAGELLAVVSAKTIQDKEDDQLFYTLVYLDEAQRTEMKLKLDHDSDIFMNLNGAKNEVILKFAEKDGRPVVLNKKSKKEPSVIHGNGPSKITLNWYGNYLADGWSEAKGCQICNDEIVVDADATDPKDVPRILLGIYITRPTPFFPEFLKRITELRYPKKALDVFVHVGAEYHTKHVAEFEETNGKFYNSIKVIKADAGSSEPQVREAAFHEAFRRGVDYVFALDSIAQLTNPDSLKLLIEANRPIIAPLLSRPKKLWSNFWGDIGADGYYLRSDDYVEVVQGSRIGVWNVPYISDAVLTHKSKFSANNIPSFFSKKFDHDMAFCADQRDKGNFLYVSNRHHFGHLVNPDMYNITHLNPDMYEIFENKLDWEEKYISANYTQRLLPDFALEQPCPDVYRFPLFTDLFTQNLIDEMEHNGEWSGGGHDAKADPRISGGYENVPTDDIHMNQIVFHDQWIQILKDYVGPIQQKAYPGFFSKSNALMNFVVRYKPNEQDFLKPHHDSSTFTINVALNKQGVDYEGGGCNFLRYDCKVTDNERGWAIIHPGRLTHYHEGLKTTAGVRYIMVSFVDP